MLTWLLLTSVLLDAPPDSSARSAERPTRLVTFGEVDLEVHAPAWSAGESLHAIGEAIRSGDRAQARTMLDRMLREWNGEILLTTGEQALATRVHDRKSTRGRAPVRRRLVDTWLRLPPVWETLDSWFHTLPEVQRQGLSSIRLFARDRLLKDVDPELWFPMAADHANRRRAVALESGDIPTAWLLDRAPTLRDRPSLERWLGNERVELAAPSSPLETSPHRKHERLQPDPFSELYLLSRHPLELDANPDRSNPKNRSHPEHFTRRSPLGAIFPLVDADHIVLGTGSQAFSVSTSRPPKVEWSIDARAFGTNRSRPSLLLAPLYTTASGRYRAILFRNDRDEVEHHPSKHIFDRMNGVEEKAFHQLIVFDATTTPPRPYFDLSDHLPAGATVCGRPVIEGERLFVPVFQGLRRIEIEVFAFDLEHCSPIWSRHIGSQPTRWISSRDLRGLIPEVELTWYAGEVLVSTSVGLLTRLDARTGYRRGVQFFPQLDEFEHRVKGPGRNLARFFGVPFPNLPAPRPRYPAPSLVIERSTGPLWVTLPPKAMHLIAVDLRTWRVAWKVPVEAQTTLLGMVGGEIALLDTGIRIGEHRMSYRTVALDGRHSRFADLELDLHESRTRAGELDLEGPLLVGMPRLLGHQLWIPTLNALEIFDVGTVSYEETQRKAGRVVPWPSGATGGTPFPVPGGKIVTVGRGDQGLGKLGYLEIFEAN